MVYEKIVVRNRVYRHGELNSKLVLLTADRNFNTINDFKKYYSDATIMEELFNEKVENMDIEDTNIYKKYLEVLNTGQDNELFQVMYKAGGDFALEISEHIYLYHITRLEVAGKEVVPWKCVDNKSYLADTWWESDEGVLHDINNLSYIEFITKYKAY